MFLSEEQLQTLTARKRPKAQAKVLEEQSIPFTLDGDGWPVVLVSSLASRGMDVQDQETEPTLVLVPRSA